ncbi:MAG: hypothetical protein AAF399_30965, partial [Bacteroidota bacterium]
FSVLTFSPPSLPSAAQEGSRWLGYFHFYIFDSFFVGFDFFTPFSAICRTGGQSLPSIADSSDF